MHNHIPPQDHSWVLKTAPTYSKQIMRSAHGGVTELYRNPFLKIKKHTQQETPWSVKILVLVVLDQPLNRKLQKDNPLKPLKTKWGTLLCTSCTTFHCRDEIWTVGWLNGRPGLCTAWHLVHSRPPGSKPHHVPRSNYQQPNHVTIP